MCQAVKGAVELKPTLDSNTANNKRIYTLKHSR